MAAEQLRKRLAMLAGTLLLAAALAAQVLTPGLSANAHTPGLIDAGLPHEVDGWTLAASPLPQVELTVGATGRRSNDNPYDEVVMRSYADASGRSLMVAVAYAAQQRQDVKIHRPDLCYPGQGFELQSWSQQALLAVRNGQGPINSVRMLARRGSRQEAVVYWLRTGDDYGQSAWDGRLAILRSGLQGQVSDGVLVRASMRVESAAELPEAYARMEAFLGALVQLSSAPARALLVR